MTPEEYISKYKELDARRKSFISKNCSNIDRLRHEIAAIEQEVTATENEYSNALIDADNPITEETENKLLHEIEAKKSKLNVYKKSLDKCCNYNVYKEKELQELAAEIHDNFENVIDTYNEQLEEKIQKVNRALEEITPLLEELYTPTIKLLQDLAVINIKAAKYYDADYPNYFYGYPAGEIDKKCKNSGAYIMGKLTVNRYKVFKEIKELAQKYFNLIDEYTNHPTVSLEHIEFCTFE